MKRALPLALLVSLGACSSWRWSSRAPAPPQQEKVLFYSDLGPDRIDASSYPLRQRHNYRVYAQTCSRCHTLARSVNAPAVSAAWWRLYVGSMRIRARLDGRPLTRDEIEAVIDFLEYDGRQRKLSREFEAETEALRRRFDELTDERLRGLQKGRQPRLLHE